jgi:hypothetical protein
VLNRKILERGRHACSQIRLLLLTQRRKICMSLHHHARRIGREAVRYGVQEAIVVPHDNPIARRFPAGHFGLAILVSDKRVGEIAGFPRPTGLGSPQLARRAAIGNEAFWKNIADLRKLTLLTSLRRPFPAAAAT